MKERLQQLWPNIKFAWRCMGDSWKTFGETEEVRALRRAFRVFWWRLGDVFALIGRLIWAWFLNTRMVRSAQAWWQRTKKAVDRKSTRLNSSHSAKSRMPSSA